jgi:hypothetical protein
MNGTVRDSNWKFSEFKSKPPKSPFAPIYHYIFAENFIEGIDFKKIANIILEKEKIIINTTPPTTAAYTGLGNDSLTSRWKSFNVFSWTEPEIEKLKVQIHEKYLEFLQAYNVPRSNVMIQCWANVMRESEEMCPHIHSTDEWSYLGGHVTVQCEDTSTVYINPINQINDPEIYVSYNRIGKITLFQHNIPHYTTPHHSTTNSERITLAFDISLSEFVNLFEHNDHPEWHNYVIFDNPTGIEL